MQLYEMFIYTYAAQQKEKSELSNLAEKAGQE